MQYFSTQCGGPWEGQLPPCPLGARADSLDLPVVISCEPAAQRANPTNATNAVSLNNRCALIAPAFWCTVVGVDEDRLRAAAEKCVARRVGARGLVVGLAWSTDPLVGLSTRSPSEPLARAEACRRRRRVAGVECNTNGNPLETHTSG
jgi:hypothetical protein